MGKKLTTLSLLILILIGCSDSNSFLPDPEDHEFRLVAYSSLCKEDRALLRIHFQDAKIFYGNYSGDNLRKNQLVKSDGTEISFVTRSIDENGNTLYKFTKNQKLVGVVFPITDESVGKIITILDYESKNVIGYVPLF